MVIEVEPSELNQQLATATPPVLIDVREGWELEIARLQAARHIPMGEIASRLDELPRDRPIVVMCRSGGRSMQVARLLEQQGFDRVANLTGGILAWREQIDPTISPY